MTIISTNHVSFTVSDINNSIEFYRSLGFEMEGVRYHVSAEYVREVTGYKDAVLHIAFLTCPGCRLELIQYIQPKGVDLDKQTKNTGSAHICLNVDNIQEVYEELSSRGVKFRSKPVLIPSGPHQGGYAVYLLDLDGISVELIQLG